MLEYSGRSDFEHGIDAIQKRLSCQRKKTMKSAHAAAEACLQSQGATFRNIIGYVQAVGPEVITPLVLAYRVSYDETPLLLNIAFTEGFPSPELAKFFAAQSDWTMLLRYEASGKLLMLHGLFSPTLRCTDTATGKAIAAFLKSVCESQLPKPEAYAGQFAQVARVAELDSAPANTLAERSWRKSRPEFTNLELHCIAHKNPQHRGQDVDVGAQLAHRNDQNSFGSSIIWSGCVWHSYRAYQND